MKTAPNGQEYDPATHCWNPDELSDDARPEDGDVDPISYKYRLEIDVELPSRAFSEDCIKDLDAWTEADSFGGRIVVRKTTRLPHDAVVKEG